MEGQLLTLYSDVKAVPVRWLWYPYIAIGKITLLQGDPGDGKSTMMMHLIAELSTGGATPDGQAFGRPHKIIYQCSEDGAADTIKPRLEACGADCRNISYSTATDMRTSGSGKRLFRSGHSWWLSIQYSLTSGMTRIFRLRSAPENSCAESACGRKLMTALLC